MLGAPPSQTSIHLDQERPMNRYDWLMTLVTFGALVLCLVKSW